ncbi:MAG TPA: MMPL family transporter [bacterium]|nr:MMPL family transporter [bacterium]
MEKFFRCWVRWLLKYYGVVILLVLALSALSFPRMIRLFKTISTDPIDLLPRNYPSVQTLLQLRDKLEPKKRFAVVFESDNPEQTQKLIQDLKLVLEKNPYVGQALITKVGYEYFDKHKLLFLELDDLKDIRHRIDRKIQREKLGPLYISFDEEEDANLDFEDMEAKYRKRYGGEAVDNKYYVSPNGRLYAIYVESKQPNLTMAEERNFQDEVQKVVQGFDIKAYDPSMKMYFSGSTRVMEYRALIHDLKIAGIISGALIFLPLLLRFRKPQYVFLIFLPLAVGIPMGLALSSLWVAKLNVTTSFLFAILGGLGVETGIHVFSRYYEERHGGVPLETTLTEIYLSLGPAVLTAVASLAVTFLLMIFSDFKGFSEFGLISGLGLIVLFLLYFTFFPALLVLGEKIRLLHFGGTIREFEGRFSFSSGFVRPMLVLFSLITVFSILATPYLKFEYDTKKIRADDPSTRLDKIRQRATSGERLNNPAAVIIHNRAEAEAIKAAVEKIRDSNPDTTVQGTNSIYSLVPGQQEEKMAVLKDIQKMLEDDTIKLVPDDKRADLDRFRKAVTDTTMVKEGEAPPEVTERFIGDPAIPGSVMMILAKPRIELDDGRKAIAFAAEISKLETPKGTFQASSDAIVFADVLTTMIRDSEKVLVISVLSVSFFVFLNFRNVRKTLLVMFSILAGVFWVMGVMFLAGVKLNLYNMVMIPAVMGMSIDNSIHIYHRYEELGAGSLPKVLTTTGVSALLASMTNAAGFFGLVFCTHGGLRSMGQVAAIGLGTCLITTLLYLPMILKFFEDRKLRRQAA